MKKKFGWIIVAVLMVVLIAGASVLYRQYSDEVERESLVAEEAAQTEASTENETSEESGAEESGAEELVLAPDFTVYDADGNAVNLSDFFGKPIVLNFWASWCGPCQMDMPAFHEAYLTYGEEVQFLMINMTSGRETLETAKSFMEDKGYTFPVYYDTEYSAAMTYGVNSLPSTYFIDKEGHAIARAQGAIDGDTLLYGMKMISEHLGDN